MPYDPGIRVVVYDGTGEKLLGYGTYEGDVTVYVTWADGAILTEQDPTKARPGAQRVEGNPRIRMDDGRIVYGCQVWWGPAPPT